MTPNSDGLLFVPLQARDKFPLIWTPNKEYIGDTVRIAAETDDLHAPDRLCPEARHEPRQVARLVRAAEIEVTDVTIPRSAQWIAYGKEVYERRCIGCHGDKGDGNGPAATFLFNQRPRNFSAGVFKFRLSQKPVPTDGDLLRTITRGVRGTAMPAWYELPINDRLAVIQYIKYDLAVDRSDANKPYAYFTEEPPGQPLYIGQPPAPSPEIIAHGKDIWQNAKCWECHGQTGKGDGEKAAGLKDDFGFPVRPADLTSGQFKSGPAVEDIFRTMSTGLSGTPMPSFRDSLPEQDRWALAYYVLSLSAFTDPLTGEPLTISAADPDGARRSQATGEHSGRRLCSGRGPEAQRFGIRHGIGGARGRARSPSGDAVPQKKRVNHDRLILRLSDPTRSPC